MNQPPTLRTLSRGNYACVKLKMTNTVILFITEADSCRYTRGEEFEFRASAKFIPSK